MKIIKLNRDTIRCEMTTDELKAYGLQLSDFMNQTEAATGFLHDLLKRAESEVGYSLHGNTLTMKIMQLPDGLNITISDSAASSAGKTEDFLSHMMRLFSHLYQEESKGDSSQDEQKEAEFSLEPEKEEEEKQEKKPDVLFPAYHFENMDLVTEFAEAISYGRAIRSDLYQDGRGYLLILHKDRMSDDSFEKMCVMAHDYGYFVPEGRERMEELDKAGKIVVRDKALSVLRML